MKTQLNFSRFGTAALLILGGALLGGCTKTVTRTEVREVVVERQLEVPGAVQAAWEEPMVDVVEVPPGLDPEGHYYRPAHREILEIRQGRWRYYDKAGN